MRDTCQSVMILIKNKYYFTVVIIVCIQFILAFQGFDVCDDGFVLTGYQQIFNAPESVEYNFVYWLSTIIGGLWYELFPGGGVFWFRILAIVVNTLTFMLSYQLLKRYTNPKYTLLGLTMVLFVNDFGYLVFYHNQLTALFAVLIAYFLERGLATKNIKKILISGILIGVNVSTRIPNITLLALVMVIPYYQYLNKKHWSSGLRWITMLLLGFVIGLSLIVFVMLILGHISIIRNAFETLFNLGSTRGSGHSIADLIHVTLFNYKKVAILMVYFIAYFFVVKKGVNYFQNTLWLRYLIYVISFFVVGLPFVKGGIHAVYAFSLVSLLTLLLSRSKPVMSKVMAFIAILIMMVLPLGSGGGMISSGYMCIWLSVPFALSFVSEGHRLELHFAFKKHIVLKPNAGKSMSYIATVIAISFLTIKTYRIINEAYFDPGYRWYKTYSINNAFTKTVYTTKERATIINDLMTYLNNYVKAGDYLLTFDSIPMVHFMTETKPYAYNPWLMIYDSHSFAEKLNKAEQTIDVYPIVVVQKFATIEKFSEPISNYLNEEQEVGVHYNRARTVAMNTFLKTHDYEVVWYNDYFSIYKTLKTK